MRQRKMSHLLKLAPLLLGFAALPVPALQIVTEESRPFNYTENGKLTGLATEVVIETGRRAKVPMTFAVMPWPQAYEFAQTRNDACIYSTARVENRERVFKWVGPLSADVWGLFAKTGFKDPIATLTDARPYRIGGVTNDAKVMWLRERAVTNIVTANEEKLIPPLLTLDRNKPGAVDLWVTGIYTEKSVAAAAGVTDTKLVLKISEQPLWLACNPAVSNDTIKSLTDALAGINKDGTYRKIFESYNKKFAP